MTKAKPFIKWVGGKGQLIGQLETLLPEDFDSLENVTYIEPFVGGGAMLFNMLQSHSNIKNAVINDINPDLIGCFRTVKDAPHALIKSLNDIQDEYYSLISHEERKKYFLEKRSIYNTESLNEIENSSLFIFLNRTCFNGLYRVNKSGLFNVPFGKYEKPTICDKDTILKDSELLQNVTIMCGDFEATVKEADGITLFYLDPPYRPLSNTSSFNDYTKEKFNDDSQIRLKKFCDTLHAQGHMFMLSNSDCMAKCGDTFFDELFSNYYIERVFASRNVNSNPDKRGKLSEIVVRNFTHVPQVKVCTRANGSGFNWIGNNCVKAKTY